MELKILDKQEKTLLSRTEIKATVSFTGAIPSNADVKKAVATELKADEKLVVVKKIDSKFKETIADVLAYYYINETDMKRIEEVNKKKKEVKKEGAEAAPAAKPAEKKEAPKAEAKPAAKEEPKAEEKK